MSEPFVMVFSEEDRDALIDRGFQMIYGDGKYFLFENDDSLDIGLPDGRYALTCIMSFVGQPDEG